MEQKVTLDMAECTEAIEKEWSAKEGFHEAQLKQVRAELAAVQLVEEQLSGELEDVREVLRGKQQESHAALLALQEEKTAREATRATLEGDLRRLQLALESAKADKVLTEKELRMETQRLLQAKEMEVAQHASKASRTAAEASEEQRQLLGSQREENERIVIELQRKFSARERELEGKAALAAREVAALVEQNTQAALERERETMQQQNDLKKAKRDATAAGEMACERLASELVSIRDENERMEGLLKQLQLRRQEEDGNWRRMYCEELLRHDNDTTALKRETEARLQGALEAQRQELAGPLLAQVTSLEQQLAVAQSDVATAEEAVGISTLQCEELTVVVEQSVEMQQALKAQEEAAHAAEEEAARLRNALETREKAASDEIVQLNKALHESASREAEISQLRSALEAQQTREAAAEGEVARLREALHGKDLVVEKELSMLRGALREGEQLAASQQNQLDACAEELSKRIKWALEQQREVEALRTLNLAQRSIIGSPVGSPLSMSSPEGGQALGCRVVQVERTALASMLAVEAELRTRQLQMDQLQAVLSPRPSRGITPLSPETLEAQLAVSTLATDGRESELQAEIIELREAQTIYQKELLTLRERLAQSATEATRLHQELGTVKGGKVSHASAFQAVSSPATHSPFAASSTASPRIGSEVLLLDDLENLRVAALQARTEAEAAREEKGEMQRAKDLADIERVRLEVELRQVREQLVAVAAQEEDAQVMLRISAESIVEVREECAAARREAALKQASFERVSVSMRNLQEDYLQAMNIRGATTVHAGDPLDDTFEQRWKDSANAAQTWQRGMPSGEVGSQDEAGDSTERSGPLGESRKEDPLDGAFEQRWQQTEGAARQWQSRLP